MEKKKQNHLTIKSFLFLKKAGGYSCGTGSPNQTKEEKTYTCCSNMKDKDSLTTTCKQTALTSRSMGFNYHILQIMNKKDTNQANLQ